MKQNIKHLITGIVIGIIAVIAFNMGKCQAQSETEVEIILEVLNKINTMSVR
jgi:hypothetical protein